MVIKYGDILSSGVQHHLEITRTRLARSQPPSRPSSQVQAFTMLVIPVVLLSLISVTVAAPTTDSRAENHLQKRAIATCYPIERPETSVLNLNDCNEAIKRIPTTKNLDGAGQDRVDGQFGTYGPAWSPFKLPRHFAHGNCMIGVTMVSSAGGSETASWNDISEKASAIVTECVSRPGIFRRGGTAKSGRHDQILIEMFNYSAHLAFLVPLNDFVQPRNQVGPPTTA